MKNQYYSNGYFDRAVENRNVPMPISSSDFLIISFEQKFYFLQKEEEKELALFPLEFFSHISLDVSFLGIQGGKNIWTAQFTEEDIENVAMLLSEGQFYDMRALAGEQTQEQGALLAYALGINRWNQMTKFCGQCGTGTKSMELGHSKQCKNPECASVFYPQISPAIIVLIEYCPKDGEPLCLLSKRKISNGYMCSAFAGYVEIGERLEDAVVREMKEEVNLAVTNLRYVDSQPWSFSSSIMVGFIAEATDTVFEVDGKEIMDAAWFSAKQIQELVAKDELVLSKSDSIARFLIESWVANTIN